VLSVPRVDGWRCRVDGGKPATPRDFGGLMAVPLPTAAGRVDCSYVPPGLRRGLAVGAAGAVAPLGIVLIGAVRRRRVTS
jgi:uncharacterized membrane protein YfhO